MRCITVALLDSTSTRDMPGVPTPATPGALARPFHGVEPGLEVSLGDFLQNGFVETQVRHHFLGADILLFHALQPLGLINAKPAVLPFPTTVGLLTDTALLTGVLGRYPFARLDLDRMSKFNDVFRCIPFASHSFSFPGFHEILTRDPV